MSVRFSIGDIVVVICSLIIGFVGFWITLPAFFGWGFKWLLMVALLPGVIWLIVNVIEGEDLPVISLLETIVFVGLAVFMIIYGIFGSAMFHAKSYANTIQVESAEGAIETEIPSIDDIEDVVLMDTATAEMLMDRAFGGLTEYVSQFERGPVSTCVIEGKEYKIAPLDYAGFWKWKNNDSIPGYLLLDTDEEKAQFVSVEGGIKYSPSAYFGDDLERHARGEHPGAKFYRTDDEEDPSMLAHFQLDEKGAPCWVIPTFEYEVWGGAKTPNGAIVVNACTGESVEYKLGEAPEWVDNIVDGNIASELYNRYGDLLNGYWNFSDTGRTMVTDDFGYIQKDGVINIYTGVTSVAGDESNIGFIMVNTNTGKFTYYAATDSTEETAAEEYSAMSAAEDIVQNYGYKASFPSLISIENRPAYAMVLKSDSGLIAGYGLVDMADISKAAFGKTLEECKKEFYKIMGYESESDIPDVPDEPDIELPVDSATVTIETIQFAVIDGNSIVYIKTNEGLMLKQSLKENEMLITLNVGDVIAVQYYNTEKIATLISFEVKVCNP